jgi:superfamily I DNA/RNA helicase/mRNA-degrading endonuclease RelE of RelBE toxin-antitoxin system
VYEIIQKPGFLDDLLTLEKSVQKKVTKAVTTIRADPFGSTSKKLKGYQNVYRSRIGDHRLCYSVGTGCVSLLAVGPRKNIYDRFDVEQYVVRDVDFDSAKVRVIPTAPGDAIPSTLPPGEDTSDATPSAGATDKNVLLRALLEVWGIPEEHHKAILKCRTPEDLIELKVPAEHIGTILHVQSPPHAEELAEQPSLVLNEPEDLDKWLDGSFAGFLLRLDPEQEKAAAKTLKGPAMVKGGPGTGKSIVALHRIRNMFSPEAQTTLFGGSKPRVLFVTYTNSLTRASQQLLRTLLLPADLERVDVMTLDALAAKYARGAPPNRAGTKEMREFAEMAKTSTKFSGDVAKSKSYADAVAKLSPDYLVDEFEWVIDGRGISSLSEYVEAPRAGRGTRFDLRTREAVWQVYREWRELLHQEKHATFGQVQLAALAAAQRMDPDKKYDCVVVDEAQDLKPAGIRLALAMCKSPEGFYLTADEGQSIYSRGYSWKSVSEDLRLQGRTVTLKRNYRSTAEVQAATDQFLVASGLSDSERKLEAVRHGDKPVAIEAAGDIVEVLANELQSWTREHRVPIWSTGVLVRSKVWGDKVATRLKELGLPAEFVGSGSLDLEAKHVKVMTVHTAKGLEFPIVAVIPLANNVFPPRAKSVEEADRKESDQQERRLFHVAMSRAMRRLVVVYPKADPSDFVADLDSSLWEWRRE